MKLTDYVDEVYAISRKSKVSTNAAVDLFIVNLNVMNEFHKGSGTFNYRAMGQEWGRLPSPDKVRERKALRNLIAQGENNQRRSRRVAEE